MRFRNTLLVVLVFLALGGYAYFFEYKQEEPEELATRTAPLWDVRAEEIQQLDIRGPDGGTRLMREEDAWVLVDPATEERQPADTARVDRIIDSLARLQPLRVLTETMALSEYGLASPAWQATIRMQSGEEQTLAWGDQTPQGTSYYVKKGGEDAVYIISGLTIEELERLVREPAYEPTPTPTATPMPAETAEAVTPPAETPSAERR